MQGLSANRIPREEVERLRKKLDVHSGSGAGDKDLIETGSQPNPPQRQNIKCIHQIYGLFRDDKEMPLLFQQSSAAWQKHAVHTEAQYRLWSADEVDALARSHLPAEVLRIYEGARYPVMRADIGRILILYVYGGLYADLDVLPNRERIAQCSLGIARMRARPPVQRWEWEMELLVATAGSPTITLT